MPRGRKRGRRKDNLEVNDFRHEEATRKNNLPAGLASIYEVRERGTTQYQYDPHLDPQLVWAGKAEHTSFEVDVVPLHIHEYISPKAILRAVRRPEALQLDLFGETPLPADQQVEFYKHEVGWTNRLILGDSLLVMNSLLVKEGMAGKVQMIYMDPPYGIKYSSNFQPRIDRRDVKDEDVTTWFLYTDYDGKTFHICQAFFPGDNKAWEKLQRALKATIPPETFEQMRGAVSFPFKPGEHKRIAVKVIDFRGNEVVRIVQAE